MDAFMDDGVILRPDVPHEDNIRIDENGSRLNVLLHVIAGYLVYHLNTSRRKIRLAEDVTRQRGLVLCQAHLLQNLIEWQGHRLFKGTGAVAFQELLRVGVQVLGIDIGYQILC